MISDKKPEDWIDCLSPELFWDIDRKSLDLSLHAGWLLKRVLEYGRWDDWLLVRDHFSKEQMGKKSENLKIDEKAGNFLEHYLCR